VRPSESLTLYRRPEALPEALSAAAQNFAEILDGFALLYLRDVPASEPNGWAGFRCAADAQAAGTVLERFRDQVEKSEKAIRTTAPDGPERIWQRGAGGIYGFRLEFEDRFLGVVLAGCPGPWPRDRSTAVDSVLKQLALMMDHHAARTAPAHKETASDDVLELSEQLLAYELQVKQSEEYVRKIEQARDELVEKLSHELRVPVHGMIERVISVLTAELEVLSPASRQTLRQALDDGATYLRTLQHMLDLWRLKQGSVPLEIQEVNLYEVVEEAVFNVQDRLQPGVELKPTLSKGLSRVRTDLAKLNQILFLLLDNAVKFTVSGRVKLHLQMEDGQLLCTVSDTGIGIAPTDQKNVFEEFFQVDSPTDGRYRGAGLGLPLARALVARLGGALSVTSEIGRGSRFAFTLPLNADLNQSPTPQPS
jgi:signal transduction histidine kinase